VIYIFRKVERTIVIFIMFMLLKLTIHNVFSFGNLLGMGSCSSCNV